MLMIPQSINNSIIMSITHYSFINAHHKIIKTVVTFRLSKQMYSDPSKHETLNQCSFNPLTAGAAYIRVFIFISTLSTNF